MILWHWDWGRILWGQEDASSFLWHLILEVLYPDLCRMEQKEPHSQVWFDHYTGSRFGYSATLKEACLESDKHTQHHSALSHPVAVNFWDADRYSIDLYLPFWFVEFPKTLWETRNELGPPRPAWSRNTGWGPAAGSLLQLLGYRCLFVFIKFSRSDSGYW